MVDLVLQLINGNHPQLQTELILTLLPQHLLHTQHQQQLQVQLIIELWLLHLELVVVLQLQIQYQLQYQVL